MGVTGCDSNPTPKPLTPAALATDPASSAEGPQSAPPTAPAMPVAAQGTGPRAAKAFVRHWIETLNYAVSTGDTSQVRVLSMADCESCNAMTDKVDLVYHRGGEFRGKGWVIRTIRFQPYQPKTRPVLSVGLFVAPQTMIGRAGETLQRFPGGRNLITFRLKRAGSGWRVAGFERLS